MSEKKTQKNPSMVHFIKVFDDPETYWYYTRYQLNKVFKFMGCKHSESYLMTKFIFKTLTKSIKKMLEKIEILKHAPEKEDDESDEEDQPNFFSSSTDTATSFFAKREFYRQRFLSLEEFGFKPRKIRQKKGGKNKFLIKKLAELLSKLFLQKYNKVLLTVEGVVPLIREDFLSIVKICLVAFNYNKISRINDFIASCDFEEKQKSLIVLVGGTSGSGKSTLASILSTRLGIDKIISTDSIRNMIREFSFIDEGDKKILHSSSYNTGDDHFLGIKDQTKRTIKGFTAHCDLVEEYVDSVIKKSVEKRESIIIEGVHLTMEIMKRMIKKYNCLGYLVYIANREKHKNRMTVRSRYMALDIHHNKYIKNFKNIRIIQDELARVATLYNIPKINNSNVDRSVHYMHYSIFKTHAKGEKTYDGKTDKIKIVDPNKYTDEFKTRRMMRLINKKRRNFEGKNVFEDVPKKRKNWKNFQVIHKGGADVRKKKIVNQKLYMTDSILDPTFSRVSSTVTKKRKKKKKQKKLVNAKTKDGRRGTSKKEKIQSKENIYGYIEETKIEEEKDREMREKKGQIVNISEKKKKSKKKSKKEVGQSSSEEEENDEVERVRLSAISKRLFEEEAVEKLEKSKLRIIKKNEKNSKFAAVTSSTSTGSKKYFDVTSPEDTNKNMGKTSYIFEKQI